MIQSGLEGAGGGGVSRGFFSFGMEVLELRRRPGGRLRGRIIAQEERRRPSRANGTGSSCESDEARGSQQREAYVGVRLALLATENEIWRSKLAQYLAGREACDYTCPQSGGVPW